MILLNSQEFQDWFEKWLKKFSTGKLQLSKSGNKHVKLPAKFASFKLDGNHSRILSIDFRRESFSDQFRIKLLNKLLIGISTGFNEIVVCFFNYLAAQLLVHEHLYDIIKIGEILF